MAGDEAYLLPRDQGPVRRYARDIVDSRRNVLGLFMPAALGLIFVMLAVPQVQLFISPAMLRADGGHGDRRNPVGPQGQQGGRRQVPRQHRRRLGSSGFTPRAGPRRCAACARRDRRSSAAPRSPEPTRRGAHAGARRNQVGQVTLGRDGARPADSPRCATWPPALRRRRRPVLGARGSPRTASAGRQSWRTVETADVAAHLRDGPAHRHPGRRSGRLADRRAGPPRAGTAVRWPPTSTNWSSAVDGVHARRWCWSAPRWG